MRLTLSAFSPSAVSCSHPAGRGEDPGGGLFRAAGR